MCPLVLLDLTVQEESAGGVKRQRTKKVFEGHTEVRAGLNATVDPSLRRVSNAAFGTTVRQPLMDLFPHISAVIYLKTPVMRRMWILDPRYQPHTFFHVILYQIVPHITQFASHCVSSSRFINTIYGDFHNFIRERRNHRL